MATTYTLSFLETDPQGAPLVSATILIELTTADYTSTESVLPEIITLTTDAAGAASVSLISNASGSQGTQYRIRILNTLGATVDDQLVTMPAANANFRDLIETTPPSTLTQAETTLAAVLVNLALTNADVVLTNADVVLTGLDVVLTAADVVLTAADVVLTGLDATQTAADATTTQADAVITQADASITAADVILTNADVVLTNADVVFTNADVVLTGLDVIDTIADVVLTHADVILTNADVTTAASSASSAATSATTSGSSASAAASSASAAGDDAANTATDALQTALDAISTAADVVLTGIDVDATLADVVLTHADVVLTNADVVLTNADVVLTALDVIDTAADLVLTNADVVLTGLDEAATDADRIQTGVDLLATNADLIATNNDVVTTTADAVATNADRVLADVAAAAALVSQSAAAGSATAAASDAADLSAINLNISETPSFNADPGTIPVRGSDGLIGNDSIEWSVPGISRDLGMTTAVSIGIFSATEKGVPDAWRFNRSASWYTETRTTGTYLGEFINVTAGAGADGAAIGDYYYDETLEQHRELTNIGTPASSETLRAGSAEFPAKIIIVGDGNADYLNILDAKDGTLWMRFRGLTDNMIAWNNIGSATTFKNGLLVTGQDSFDLWIIDFLSDSGFAYSNASHALYSGNIEERNDANGRTTISTADKILSRSVLAVAIGDASKDYGFDEWGVPKQYIAVGCDTTHGISVIHPNGKVYDISGQSAAINHVAFNKYNEIIATGKWNDWTALYSIPFRDVSFLSQEATFNLSGAAILTLAISDDKIISPRRLPGVDTASSLVHGILVVDYDRYGIDGVYRVNGDSSISFIGYDFVLDEYLISPLVDYDVTSAIGMEIGVSNLVESELVVNGGFDSDVSSWEQAGAGDPTLTWNSGEAVATSGSTSNVLLAQGIPTVIGQVYYTTVDRVASNSSNAIYVTNILAGTLHASSPFTSVLKHTLAWVATATTSYVEFVGGSPGSEATVDNFFTGVATQDRSQLNNNKHAKINGTITRAKYDGGDVVMHQGAVFDNNGSYNTGAYWEVGYDVFAAGGVILDVWVDFVSTTAITPLISNRGLDGSDNPVATADTGAAANKGSVIYQNGTGSSFGGLNLRNAVTTTVVDTPILTADSIVPGLYHIVVIAVFVTGVKWDYYVFINGELNKVTADITITPPDNKTTYIHPYRGVALQRVGGLDRKDTADYYRWKYAKERRLFDIGAQASLQGTGIVVRVTADEISKTYTVLQTDAYTTFDQDGIVVDTDTFPSSKDRGAEVAANGTDGAGVWTEDSGTFTYAGDGSFQPITFGLPTEFKTYFWSFNLDSINAGTMRFDGGSGSIAAAISSTGLYSGVFLCPASPAVVFQLVRDNPSTTDFVVSNFTIKEIITGAKGLVAVSVSTHDGDLALLDERGLTISTRDRDVHSSLVKADRVATKRTFEYDSLVEASPGIFGTSFTSPPITSGDTIGGAVLDWSGAESADPTVTNAMIILFDDQAGDYLFSFTIANRTAGSIKFDPDGTDSTGRTVDGSYTETLTYDPAADSSSKIRFRRASSFDGQVIDYRIRPVGIPHWIGAGWRIETVWENGAKVRPDTPDLVRDGLVTRRFDGKQGWLSTADVWNILSIDVVEDV